MEQFLMGAIAMASTIVALFFLRFWRETGDRLFAMFALAFLLLGITRFGLAVSRDVPGAPAAAVQKAEGGDAAAEPRSPTEVEEAHTHWYWVRFAAFVLILIAIVDKNRR
jgi:hypothetical protein